MTCDARKRAHKMPHTGAVRWWTCPPQGAPGAATSNLYARNRMAYKLGKALTMALRGSACFDFQEYRERSRDLPANLPDDKLWEHFVHDGQFEGRHFRCGRLLTSPPPCCQQIRQRHCGNV